ncbi:MAG: hypothetical protein QOI76_1486 [Frankiales bacterium]|jgi:hypothetical protein|nr:hypothetical protein [Frankiales bacterium]
MSDQQNSPTPKPRRGRALITGGVLVSGIVAGGLAANTLSASAATTAATTTAAVPAAATATGSAPASTAPTTGSAKAPAAPAKTATPVRSDEKSLTSTLTATLKAKALVAVPGGTVYRIESDAGDGVYEAHMTKADGSLVTVKFDKNGNVTKVETGMGTGDPAPAGGPGGGAAGGARG